MRSELPCTDFVQVCAACACSNVLDLCASPLLHCHAITCHSHPSQQLSAASCQHSLKSAPFAITQP